MKYPERKPYHTRQRAMLHKKLHAELKYNMKQALYNTLSRILKNNLDITDFKILSIKNV